MKKCIFAVLLCVFSIQGFALKSLEGRWSLGGSAKLPFVVRRNLDVNWNMELRPQASYFPWRGLELSIEPIFGARIMSTSQDGRGFTARWGSAFYARYYFKVHPNIHIYTGLGASFKLTNWRNQSILNTIDIPLGILLSYWDNFAIDVAAPISAQFARTKFKQASMTPMVVGFKYFL